MRAVIQRVAQARVEVDSLEVGAIDRGMLVLLGIAKGDSDNDVQWMARKLAALRIFTDDSGRMNLDIRQVGGAVLLVSQFTLLADLSRGNRPGFDAAELPQLAKDRVEEVATALHAAGISVAQGRFAADMQVSLVNDGPVTILLDSKRAE